MPFFTFYEFFPKIAINETRSITLLAPQHGLPPGEYAFIELYCADPDCDCRRVTFSVLKKGRKAPIATISWGWEPLEFYAKWMRGDPDPEDIADCKGPSLNPIAEQSELSFGALELCREVLLKDAVYVERIKGHYRLVRERVDGGYEPRDPGSRTDAAERKRREKTKKARKAQQAARKKNRR
ncbi:MAG: hypothetical protein GX615_05505 [Lentisphaerae bacterium]|nr:hypothetical protein [Lentisphaerota bacterium]